MEGKFETSFIPKKNLAPVTPGAAPRRTTNLFSVISIVIVITVLIIAGALFGYTKYTESNTEKLKLELKKELAKFEPALVSELSRMDVRLESAKELLNKHFAISVFFNFLETSTLKNVRFSSFKYEIKSGKVVVSMAGEAQNFSSVALQAAEFAKPANNKVLKSPQFTNLNLDKSGNVMFDFTGTVESKEILYREFAKDLAAASVEDVSTSVGTSTASSSPQQ
ncbi:MAG: hypothetical protein V4519_01040 [Patescibacteria group bacterium]